MKITLRLGLAFFAVNQSVLGLWALVFPLSFYEDFPTVDLTPPYSEHLMRDFGGATAGLAILFAAAAVWPTTRLVVVALLAYLTFSAPHFFFHAAHLEAATQTEAIILMAQLALSVAVPIGLMLLALAIRRQERMSKSGLISRETPQE